MTAGKKLFLLRHALAMPPISGGADVSRDLSPKGLEDASQLGKIMNQKGYIPDLILCSTAVRTRQTLKKLLENIPQTEIIYSEKLYTGATQAYFTEVEKIKNTCNSLLVVGHNPCIYEYAVSLSNTGRETLLQRLTEGYKPATLSVLSTNIEDWALLESKKAEIIDLLDPLDYNAPARPTRWT